MNNKVLENTIIMGIDPGNNGGICIIKNKVFWELKEEDQILKRQ